MKENQVSIISTAFYLEQFIYDTYKSVIAKAYSYMKSISSEYFTFFSIEAVDAFWPNLIEEVA